MKQTNQSVNYIVADESVIWVVSADPWTMLPCNGERNAARILGVFVQNQRRARWDLNPRPTALSYEIRGLPLCPY